MKLSLSNIKDYVDEIQYYEQMGYYKIADKLTKAITKLAWDFDPNDMGYENYTKNIGDIAARARLMGILRNTPECADLLNDINNTKPTTWEDPRNCAARLTQQWQQQNPDQTITPEVLQNIQEQCMDNSVQSSNNGFGNNLSFEACQDALTEKGYANDLGILNDTNQKVDPQKLDPRLFPGQSQQSQTRNVPRIV